MNNFNNAKILVVGGAGFVGSNLVKKLLEHKPKEILIVDNLLSAEKENIPNNPVVRFIHASITDDKVLHELHDDLDYIFHLATFHGNINSLYDPIADHDNNTLTTLKLFDRIKYFKNIKKIVYSSAGCVVAEKTFDKAAATTEEAMPSLFLDSPYQISKMIGEFYANFYFQFHQLPVVKARFQNVYGPGEILGAGDWRGTPSTVWRNVAPIFIYQALKKMPLTVENGGVATRDFIYVEDIAEGLMACALRGKPSENYNIASGAETTIRELAETINELTENPTPVAIKEKRDWDHSGTRFGATEKSERELGFKAKMPLLEGIQKTIAWTKENLNLIDSCVHKHDKQMAAYTLRA